MTGTFLPISRVGHDARQVLHLVDRLAVELDDHVARLDARLLGGPGLVTSATSAPRALPRAMLSAISSVTDWMLDAKPAAPGLAKLDQLIDNALGRVGRHRKADADRAARRRIDRRVDAHHVALQD